MKKIIVPYDFSPEAENGLHMAMVLAKRFQAKLQLVYVVSGNRDLGNLSPDEERAKAEQTIKPVMDRIRKDAAGTYEADYYIKQGKVYREIIAQAEAQKDAVIVTSTHGASGFEEFFIGSNTMRIVAGSRNPVFTIMHGVAPLKAVQTILFPLDISFQSRQKAPYVASLAKLFEAKVHIVAASETTLPEVKAKLETYRVQIEEYFRERGVAVTSETNQGNDVVDVTLSRCETTEACMIAITPREKDTHHLFLLGGKAQRFISQSPVPVVVIPPTVEPLNTGLWTQGGSAS